MPDQSLEPAVEIETDAIYEAGRFRPITPVALPPGARVRLRITLAASPAPVDATPARARLWFFGLTLSAVLLAGAAQQRFLADRAFSWAALALALLATLMIGWRFRRQPLWMLREVPPAEPRQAATLRPWLPWQLGLLATALVLMLLTLSGLAADRPGPGRPDLNWTFLPWLAAIGCVLIAMHTPGTLPRPARPAVFTVLTLLGLGALALALRLWQLDNLPATLGGDEGSQGMEALAVLSGGIQNPFGTGWLGVPTMSFYFNAPTIALLGPTASALRLPWALVGTATVLVMYLLVARLHSRSLALICAALLAGYHYHIHFSRLGSNQIADGLFAALTLLCLYRAYDRRNQFDWALCGVVIGVAQYFYAGARFTAILAGTVLLLLALRDGRRCWREQGWGVATLVCTALLAAAPMIQYAFRFPNDYNARLNEVGIIQSGWLEREQLIRGEGALPILLDQLQRAALAYNAYPDRTVWYGAPDPLFDLTHGALFLLGLGFAVLRLRDRRLFPFLAWWGGAIIMGGMLTESPPSSQRLVTTAAPAIFFVALGLSLLVQGLGQPLGVTRLRQAALPLAISTLALMLLSARFYFIEYSPQRIYGSQNAMLATELATHIKRFAPDARLVFFGWPRMGVGFGTIPYLAPQTERVDVMEPLTEPPPRDLAAAARDTAFIFLPERSAEIDFVRAAFPGGTLETLPSPLDGSALFTMYYVPR
jgi:hypothetical protein